MVDLRIISFRFGKIKMASCSLEFFCAGCNKTTQGLSWSKRRNVIAYASSHSAVLYKPSVHNEAYKIEAILNKHRDRVNCTQWIEKENSELVTGSVDKTINIWHNSDDKWRCKQTLSGHTGAIESLATYTSKDTKETFIASASADSSIRIWKASSDTDFECIQTISFGNGFALSIALSELPNDQGVILAVGRDDTSIALYGLNGIGQFEQVISLHGHEDWVRCLAFQHNGKELMLASSSQDTFIRLWKITKKTKEDENADESVTLETQSFKAYSTDFMVVLDSVLIGHEGWVLGLSWNPKAGASCLVSASMDRTLILWEYDQENEIWMDKARFGEVGGNTLGYYGCAFSGCGNSLIAHGYQGSFQLWNRDEQDKWSSSITISGHFGQVEDFDWCADGDFAITASTDQTTRLFVPWQRDDVKSTWHEIGRPQIHGYDMKCISILNKYKYVSGAQEKVARVFTAPKSFYNSLTCITKLTKDESTLEELPVGATVPVLGLSNKAVFEGDIHSWKEQNKEESKQMKASAFANEDPAPFNPTLQAVPPVEDILLQHTLWPELQKLYGHGFELFCLTSDAQGSTVATACKASTAEHANILIWDTSTWLQTDSLTNAHTLTVTQMAFSKSGKYLLSVSRDRTWALHRRSGDGNHKFSLVQKTDKKTSVHTRIIWACDWAFDDQYFVTVSRDKKALVWGNDAQTQTWCAQGSPLDQSEAITAVSVYGKMTSSGRYLIALGTESGKVSIYEWLNEWHHVTSVPQTLTPCLTIKRLRWRPLNEYEQHQRRSAYQLGVASSDHSFRILNFYL
uniref:Elongator complex protein 2 n=1 Tax=Clytia hemisphaerica TaxID=252671 RepID=A0A7M5VGT1_9CNID